jgi:hypothetical protein
MWNRERGIRHFPRAGKALDVWRVTKLERAKDQALRAQRRERRISCERRRQRDAAHATIAAMRRTVVTFRIVVLHLSSFSSAGPPNFDSLYSPLTDQ